MELGGALFLDAGFGSGSLASQRGVIGKLVGGLWLLAGTWDTAGNDFRFTLHPDNGKP